MRVQFKEEGGLAYFPGRSKPVSIEGDHLRAEETSELQRLIDGARFFELPAVSESPQKGAADYKKYTITVEAEGRSHSVQLSDPIDDPGLRELVDYVRRKAQAVRAST